MKKIIKIVFIISISLGFNSTIDAQCDAFMQNSLSYNGCPDTKETYIYVGSNCSGTLSANTNSYPWLSHNIVNNTIYFTTTEATEARSAVIDIWKAGSVIGEITITQNTTKSLWYPDTDGDGAGDLYSTPIESCSPVTGYANNNSDWCPEVSGIIANYGCPSGQILENMNWITSQTYDITGAEKTSSKIYYDELGKNIQIHAIDIKTGKTWVSETRYDAQGRPALGTLAAPVNGTSEFLYNPDFIKKPDGSTYTNADFETDLENPSSVGIQPNTLGAYYSTANTEEPYQDITERPYSRTVYSNLNPGAALKILGGNKTDTNGDGSVDNNDQWLQNYTFTMKAGEELAQAPAFNDPSYSSVNRKVFKTVSRDVHGVENVAFTDSDGKTLATARSGGSTIRNSTVAMGAQGYIDVHVPQNTTGFTINKPANINIEVFDLITEIQLNVTTTTLENGFYRISITNIGDFIDGTVNITYPENYYDYSLNHYDDIGRLTSSMQPLNHLETTYEYNTLGQLIRSTSPDEGTAEFVYRTDGQIRFSQNEKQATSGDYSYTNYDHLARPVESGVITGTFSTGMDGDMPNYFTGTRREQHFTTYDHLEAADLSFLTDVHSSYAQPSFLANNVAKTENKEDGINIITTTYYSYDIYGRVQWLIQDIAGLGVKTIDYEYDPITGQVNKVYYQKHDSNELLVHRYIYNPDDYSLTKVETSTDNVNFTTHANYNYYETGELKNIVLADGLQQTDYVYNLAGQLKAINHPTLNASNDPGGNTNDMFGMMIDYHNNDYARPIPNINSPNYGTNQYNGNIKGIRWNTQTESNVQATYSYSYDRNNWLTNATFGNYDESTNSNVDVDITSTTVVQQNENLVLQASNSITLLPGYHAQEGSNALVEIVMASQDGFTSSDDYEVSNITYDANGNIQNLQRNKNTENGSNAMDDLNYVYKVDKPNQLLRVEDSVGDVGVGDIDTQTGDNYVYNNIGQLVQNNSENIGYKYNTSGLVTEVYNSTNNNPIVKFIYDDKGKRAKKESYVNGSLSTTTFYVRDAVGSPMAIYEQQASSSVVLKEQPIYGSSRLGVFYRQDQSTAYQLTDHLGNVRAVIMKEGNNLSFTDTFTTSTEGWSNPNDGYINNNQERLNINLINKWRSTSKFLHIDPNKPLHIEFDFENEDMERPYFFVRERINGVWEPGGDRDFISLNADGHYELNLEDLQGDFVRLYFEKGNASDDGILTTCYVDNFKVNQPPNIIALSKTDYYPFGMPMPNRNVEGNYRYGYQGEFAEKEDAGTIGATNSFELRLWDSRIGRWISPDPYGQYYSPYLGMGNNPINGVDPDGGCFTKDENGNTIACNDNSSVGTKMIGHAGNEWVMTGEGWARTDGEFIGLGSLSHYSSDPALEDYSIWAAFYQSPNDYTHISYGVDSHLSFSHTKKVGPWEVTVVDVAHPRDMGTWNSNGSDGRRWIGCMSCHGENGAYRTLAYNSSSTLVGYLAKDLLPLPLFRGKLPKFKFKIIPPGFINQGGSSTNPFRIPKQISYKNLKKRLNKNGYSFVRNGKGDHKIWLNPDSGKKMTIPDHKQISIGVRGKIQKWVDGL